MNILEKVKYDSDLCFFYSSIYFYLFFQKIKLETYMSIFNRVENCYKIFTDEISMIPVIENNEFSGFKIIEHLKEKGGNEIKELKNIENIEIKELIFFVKGEKINLNEKVSNMSFFSKFLYFMILRDPLIVQFKSFLIGYFEKYIKMQCGTDYIIRQKKICKNIFDQMDEMSKKDDWDKFHSQIL